MTDRPIDDVGGEVLRRVNGLRLTPPWHECDAQYKTQWTDRFAQIRRMLEAHGLEIRRVANPTLREPPADPIFWRGPVEGDPGAEMLIRADGIRYSVLLDKGGTQTLQASFTMDGALQIGDRVLQRERAVLKEKGVLTTLAAACEVWRLHAFLEPSA